METDPKLLEILVCPMTKATLHYDREKQELVSRAAGLAYPIRGGVPVMLQDEARRLSDEERDALFQPLAQRDPSQSGARCADRGLRGWRPV